MQSRYVNIKSVYDPESVARWISSTWPDAAIAYASHLENGKVPHAHFVVRFNSTARWDKLRAWLMKVDPHSYSAPARSWSKSVRYLLHLDNPEKERIPYESLRSVNIEESELSQLLGGRKAPILADLASIGSRSPFAAFEFLVCERGHQPSEVSAAIRCLLDLERFRTFQRHVGLPTDDAYTPDVSCLDVCDMGKIADPSSDFHFFTQSRIEDSL